MDLTPPEHDNLAEGQSAYRGIRNAYGQGGVDAVFTDVLANTAGDGKEGQPCVCMDTMMSETTLSIDGAEELIERLQKAVEEAKQLDAGG